MKGDYIVLETQGYRERVAKEVAFMSGTLMVIANGSHGFQEGKEGIIRLPTLTPSGLRQISRFLHEESRRRVDDEEEYQFQPEIPTVAHLIMDALYLDLPKLVDLCLGVICKYFDCMETFGDLPLEIVQGILKKLTVFNLKKAETMLKKDLKSKQFRKLAWESYWGRLFAESISPKPVVVPYKEVMCSFDHDIKKGNSGNAKRSRCVERELQHIVNEATTLDALEEGIEELAPECRYLCLSNCKFVEKLPLLWASLNNLKQLNVGNCNFSGEVVQKLIKALTGHKIIKRLDISHCKLEEQVLWGLVSGLRYKREEMRTVQSQPSMTRKKANLENVGLQAEAKVAQMFGVKKAKQNECGNRPILKEQDLSLPNIPKELGTCKTHNRHHHSKSNNTTKNGLKAKSSSGVTGMSKFHLKQEGGNAKRIPGNFVLPNIMTGSKKMKNIEKEIKSGHKIKGKKKGDTAGKKATEDAKSKSQIHGSTAKEEKVDKEEAKFELILRGNSLVGCSESICSMLQYGKGFLSVLNLSYNLIGEPGGHCLAQFLRLPLCSLQTLGVQCCGLGKGGVECIMDALAVNRSLEGIDVGDNISDFYGMDPGIAIGKMLEQNTTLFRLFAGRNKFGSTGIFAITDGFKVNNSLQCLELPEVEFGAAGCRNLVLKLNQNGALQRLNLSNNGIPSRGCIDLAALLSCNSSMTHLNLNGNSISPAVAESFAAILARKQCALTHLYLGATKLLAKSQTMGSDGCVAIAKSLRTNTTLKHLSIEGQNVSNKGCSAIAKVIPKTQLMYLNLRHCHIGAKGACELFNALKARVNTAYCPGMQHIHLDLADNPLDDTSTFSQFNDCYGLSVNDNACYSSRESVAVEKAESHVDRKTDSALTLTKSSTGGT
eukprot:Nk52_evm48s1401 gene=Nk52_evmTU48s1401